MTDPNTHRFHADSLHRAVALLGDRWTLLILREAFFGVRRFSEIARNLGVARTVLARRLDALVEAGILDRVPYNAQGGWHEYRLTGPGRELYDIVLTLINWGDRHLAGDAGPPLLLRHTVCGQDTHAVVVCAHCATPLHPHDVRPRPGPGARVRPVPGAVVDSA